MRRNEEADRPAPMMGQLLDRVAANPEDAALREVFCDWLLEQGDPRGELMALQLRGEPTEDNQRRVAALLRKHFATWVGEPAPFLHAAGCRFERGFLVRAAVGRPKGATLRTAEATRLAGDRVFATVKEAVPLRVEPDGYAAIVFHPAMRSLRKVELHHADLLRRATEEPTAAKLEEIVYEDTRAKLRPEALRVLESSSLARLQAFVFKLRFSNNDFFGMPSPSDLEEWERRLATLAEGVSKSPLFAPDRVRTIGVHLAHHDEMIGLWLARAWPLVEGGCVDSVRGETFRLQCELRVERAAPTLHVGFSPAGEWALEHLERQTLGIRNLRVARDPTLTRQGRNDPT